VIEEALKIEEMSAQEKIKHIFRMAKVKANNKKVGNPYLRGQDGQLKIAAEGQVESVERLL